TLMHFACHASVTVWHQQIVYEWWFRIFWDDGVRSSHQSTIRGVLLQYPEGRREQRAYAILRTSDEIRRLRQTMRSPIELRQKPSTFSCGALEGCEVLAIR